MNQLYKICSLFFLFPLVWANAQEKLSLKEAIDIALENNYSVKIARNNETIATNFNTSGNAGFLPRLSTSGNVSYTSNNTIQKFFSGDERTGKGAGNTNVRLGAALTWTAFDGFRMYAVKDRLDLEEQRSRVETQREMQLLTTDLQTVYYGIVRLEQQIEIIEQSIQLNEDLKALAEAKLKIGTGTSLEVLQTSNTLSADSSTLLNLIDQLGQTSVNLNRLMGRDPAITFSVNTDVPEIVLPTLEELNELAMDQNYDMDLLRFDEKIALTSIKEAKSDLYPTVDLNAGFNYNFSRAEVGFLLSNRTFGPTVGLGFTYDIFNGRNLKKDIQNAEIFRENIVLGQEDLELSIKSEITRLYKAYQALMELQDLEERNLEVAQRNTALAEQLYRSGRATNFDVRESILVETQVKDRLSQVQFRQKVTEIQIKQIAGIPLFNVLN